MVMVSLNISHSVGLTVFLLVAIYVDRLEEQNPETMELLEIILLAVKVCPDTINNNY
jgi:hypothetical protein